MSESQRVALQASLASKPVPHPSSTTVSPLEEDCHAEHTKGKIRKMTHLHVMMHCGANKWTTAKTAYREFEYVEVISAC